jgi:endonuclease/exonuclease/phosphatase family metal-dependent hydrolase
MKLSPAGCVRVWLGVLLAFSAICATFAAPAPSLPDGWSTRDVGLVGTRGMALGRGAAFILRGAGTSIGDRADSFQFAYTTLTGDGELVARITEIDSSDADATTGVMLRESVAANARFAYMRVSAKHGVAFERRGAVTTTTTTTTQSTTGATDATASTAGVARKRTAPVTAPPPSRRPTASATILGTAVDREPETRSSTSDTFASTAAGDAAPPVYLRLVRRGNVFTAYESQDGTTWTLAGTDTIPMASTISAGLVVNSHSLSELATVTFSAVHLTGAASSPAQTVTAAVTPAVSPLPPAPAASSTPSSSTPAATPASTTPTPTPAPAPPASSSSSSSSGDARDPGTRLAVLQWNVHHGGVGTDGVLDPDRIARWVAYIGPNVVSFNEVDTQEAADALHQRIEANTGHTWTAQFSGFDSLLLTRLSVQATSVCTTNSSVPQMAAQMSVLASGRTVNIWSAHLSVDSAGTRLAELRTLQSCARQWSEARVLSGDFNMQASSTEYAAATETYVDAWAAARDSGLTINFSGNCDGCTKNSRIDYVFTSQGATSLTLQSAQIFDTRDSNGYTPSDHKPMLVIYSVH